jgi:hypothetical protein
VGQTRQHLLAVSPLSETAFVSATPAEGYEFMQNLHSYPRDRKLRSDYKGRRIATSWLFGRR